MTDLAGPGSNTVNVTTADPGDTRVFAGSDTFFKDCTPGNNDGTGIPASWLNGVTKLFRGAIRGMGITVDNTDTNMLLKAVQAAGVPYAVDSGIANAMIVNVNQPGFTLADGSEIRIKALNSVTGATTIDVKNGATDLGTFNLTRGNGSVLWRNDIVAGQMFVVRYNGSSFQIPGVGITGAGLAVVGGMRNLLIVNGATPNNQMTVTADALTLEDTGSLALRRGPLSVPNIDVTASGANGLDTGSVAANTWYSIWIIYNPATNTLAGLFSTSATAPTLPTGYTLKARVGCNRTDASGHFNRLRQVGARAQYIVTASSPTPALPAAASGAAGTVNLSTGTPTWSAISLVNYVPPTAASVRGILHMVYSPGTTSSVQIAPNNSYGGLVSTNQPWITCNASVGGAVDGISFDMLLESTSIYWASSAAGGAVVIAGWGDNL